MDPFAGHRNSSVSTGRAEAAEKGIRMSSARHRAPRYQFIADAEAAEIESGAKLRGKTGDLL
jgi:hypothetical protein